MAVQKDNTEKYMREAIKQAKKAAAIGEVPIGCVIVRGGTILARGYNRRNIEGSTLAHAEIIAIKKASKKLQDWRLEDCELYVTLEPCPMCAGAIVQARIPKVVIGAMNPKAGCAGSILDLLQEKRFNHQVDKVIGVLQEQCSQMMQNFFGNCAGRKKRKKNNLDRAYRNLYNKICVVSVKEALEDASSIRLILS